MRTLGRITARLKYHSKGLVSFITAGSPTLDVTLKCLGILAENGADILELGVPFSDPIADGKIIQNASHTPVKRRITLLNVVGVVKLFRRYNNRTAIVLMSYINPVRRAGPNNFLSELNISGTDGVIMVDCPAETMRQLRGQLKRSNIQLTMLISPTTPRGRLIGISKGASGYLYLVSMQGITGSKLVNGKKQLRLSSWFTKNITPVSAYIGFGIKSKRNTLVMGELSDGVIVGSLLISILDGTLVWCKTARALRFLKELIGRLNY